MKKAKRKISAGRPVWVEAMFPGRLMKKFRQMLKEDESGELLRSQSVMIPEREQAYKKSRYHAEVYLHLSEEKRSRYGHMDFAFGNFVYSFGCYDDKSNRFFDLVSDGVLVISPREKYLDYCMREEKKILIGYPLLLSEEEEEELVGLLRAARRDVVVWHPEAETRGGSLLPSAASRLQKTVGAHFYKVRRNRFNNYFVLGINCSLFVDECIGVLCAESITPSFGFIKPCSCY
ncbi:MAG: hypothetical protein IJB48_02530, partial [Clostridia bacterium]|nr:hypothetical protein [Clostridia bacterium]